MKKTTQSGETPRSTRAPKAKPQHAAAVADAPRNAGDGVPPDMERFFAPPGVTLAEAIERLATPEDRAEADKAFAEMVLRENIMRGSTLSAGVVLFSPTDPEQHARRAKTARLAQCVMPWLQRGVLVAYGNVDGASIGQDFPAAEWRGEWDLWFADRNMAQRSTEPKTKIENILIKLPAAAAVSEEIPKRGGRPPDEDWPDIMGAFLRIVAARGLPASKADARQWVRAAAKEVPSSLGLGQDKTIDARMVGAFGKKFWNSLAADPRKAAD